MHTKHYIIGTGKRKRSITLTANEPSDEAIRRTVDKIVSLFERENRKEQIMTGIEKDICVGKKK